MAEINWTAEQLCDRCGIFTTISHKTSQLRPQMLFPEFMLLRDFPEIGYVYRKEIDGDIRILLYGHYRIAYLIKSMERIDILGVFHGTLDIERLLM